ncbi:alpha/beta fold hydrolase [Flavobacteriaceae bacterium R38]|nr:alpha/beta fold hydrolase [Flavobacteriaceae bacterium R38]
MNILHSKIIGEGTPLVILHGFLGMSDNWKTLGNQYAANGFQVHLVDQRNHGRSFHSDDFSYDIMAEDVLTYCKHHNLDRICLIGHSMGGKTAMFFAIKHPQLISRLLIADIAPKYYPVHHNIILNGLNAIDFDTIKSRKEVDLILSRYIPIIGVRQFLLKNLYWEEKEKLNFRFNLKVLTKTIDNIGVALPENTIFNGEALFLKGSKSDYITDEDNALIKLRFPNSNTETIENAGHWLHAENPASFYEKSIRFFK